VHADHSAPGLEIAQPFSGQALGGEGAYCAFPKS